MDKKEQDIFNDMLSKLKELLPDAQIRHQPETSLHVLLELEERFSLNTISVFEDYVHGKETKLPRNVVDTWMTEFRIFKMHKGDISLLNTQTS